MTGAVATMRSSARGPSEAATSQRRATAAPRRPLGVPGADLAGVHLAMTYLEQQNRVVAGDDVVYDATLDASGKRVIILGGGDTGADCLGTAHRQGAASVTQLEIMPEPPQSRAPSNPWPQWSMVMRTSSAHEEGGERLFGVGTSRFVGEAGRVTGLELDEVRFVDGRFEAVPGTRRILKADLVLLALGFVGPEKGSWLEQLGVEFDERGNVARSDDYYTSVGKVFVAGDMGRGQSLIVWAIAEGRACAAAVDAYLMGESALPRPIRASERPLA